MIEGQLFAHAGGLRQAYTSTDWSMTPLGDPAGWSATLRDAVRLMLCTKFPTTLLWGPEFVVVYNEPYVPILAEKHPSALGRPARDVFPEAWEVIGPWMRDVRGGQGPKWVEDAPVPLVRNGRLGEAYFTFCYSAVENDAGAAEGVIDIVTETTSEVIGRRRLQLLTELREALGDVDDRESMRARALPILRSAAADLASVDIEIGKRASDLLKQRTSPFDATGVSISDTPDGVVVWLDLSPPGAADAVLAVQLAEGRAHGDGHVDFLRLVAASLRQALDQFRSLEAERGIADAERLMSETMQRSLLPVPLEPDHLQVAVRYEAAAEQAQIGGDWYDSFLSPDGALQLVIGDVTGHDRQAAAAMAQVRNLLRGVAYTLDAAPSAVLGGLDRAMVGLGVGVYATAVIAQIEQPEPLAELGVRRVRFSNAGHPPPVLLEPNGSARLLETTPDLLLGLGRGLRTDHTVTLEPGASLILYTDGLVERRGVPLQDSLDWLVDAVRGRHGDDAETLCDHLLAELGDGLEDDVALLVMHAFGEGGPRPAIAGPEKVPAVHRDAP